LLEEGRKELVGVRRTIIHKMIMICRTLDNKPHPHPHIPTINK
jgi:hypothetical protein